MSERFNIKTDPSVICKEMFLVKMGSEETLGEFAQKVQFMAMDAHPGAKEEISSKSLLKSFLEVSPTKMQPGHPLTNVRKQFRKL